MSVLWRYSFRGCRVSAGPLPGQNMHRQAFKLEAQGERLEILSPCNTSLASAPDSKRDPRGQMEARTEGPGVKYTTRLRLPGLRAV